MLIKFKQVANRTVQNYETDGGGNSGIAGEAYIVGQYKVKGGSWQHFFGVYDIHEQPRSGSVFISLNQPYGNPKTSAAAASHMETAFSSFTPELRGTWAVFRKKLGKVSTVWEDDY